MVWMKNRIVPLQIVELENIIAQVTKLAKPTVILQVIALMSLMKLSVPLVKMGNFDVKLQNFV